MERPVVMYSAALRFLAAAAECSTKENKDPPSLEDAFDAPKRMSKDFLCLQRFLKERDQWRQDTQRLTMMRSAISNVRAGISIALKEDSENPRLSVGGMQREIERGLSFKDTPELVAAWEAKEKRFLKQFLETSELWSKVVMTNDFRKSKQVKAAATTTTTTTTDTAATTTTTTTTTTDTATTDTATTTTTSSSTNSTTTTNTDSTTKITKRRGRSKTSVAHAALRQIDTTMELRDMYEMGKTETWKDVQVTIKEKLPCPLENWNESDDLALLTGVEQFGRFQKSMTKVWRQSFANRFKTIPEKQGHGILTSRLRNLVNQYRYHFHQKQRDEAKRIEKEKRARIKEERLRQKQIEREKLQKLRLEAKQKKLQEKLKIREEIRQKKELLKQERKKRIQEQADKARIFKKRKLLGGDPSSQLMRKWISTLESKAMEEKLQETGGSSFVLEKKKKRKRKKNKKKPRVVLPPDDTAIELLQQNPKRGLSYERYEL